MMARAKSKTKQFKGVLAQPIDTGHTFPLNPEQKYVDEYVKEKGKALLEARKDKCLALARHYGLEIEKLDLNDHGGLAVFYAQLAFSLAIDFVPGFQEKKPGRWPREFIMYALVQCEMGKQSTSTKNDLSLCKTIVRQNADFLKINPKDRGEIKDKAFQLRNRVSTLRAKLKRDHAAKKKAKAEAQARIADGGSRIH